MRLVRAFTLPIVAAASLACDSPSSVAAPPSPRQLGLTAASSLVPLDPFGISEKIPGSHGCQAAPYRQFDFWVGNWNVFGGTSQVLAGTNIVTSVLDGCAVLENWRGAQGGRGRSLNAYDASTGRWSQMWVATGGCPFGNIFIEGTGGDGVMTMAGRREQPLGFLVTQCPGAGSVVFAHADLVRWTLLPSGSVVQQSVFANNNDPLPELRPASSGNGLRYDPVTTVTPINLPDGPSFCQFRPAARHFDFMVGTWDVHQGNGNGSQGTATFSKDLTNCLLEEHFEGPGGYEGMSFNTFDAFTQKWVRTWVDNDGQRILMTGSLQNGAMVLHGTKNGSAERAIEVRITWTPVEPSRVTQLWEYSRDGGESWQAGQQIVFTKR
jgi:hypothetical protein